MRPPRGRAERARLGGSTRAGSLELLLRGGPAPALAAGKLPWAGLREPIGKTVRDQVELNAVLEQGFRASEHEREALGGRDGQARGFLQGAAEARIGDADERRAVRARREDPLDVGRRAVR